MVMEFVEGEDLANYLDEHGKFSEPDAIAIIIKVGKALSHVHQQGFLHRDIKPANILLRKADLSPVLIDFGLAREYTPGTIRSMTNSKTERYAPIEQYQRNGNFGAWTDVYALAATLYTLLTARPPIPSNVRKEVSSNILISPKQHNPEISDRINEAILKGMEIEPGDRPQSIEEWFCYSLINQTVRVSLTEDSACLMRYGFLEPLRFEQDDRLECYLITKHNNLHYLFPVPNIRIIHNYHNYNYKILKSIFQCNDLDYQTIERFCLIKPAIVGLTHVGTSEEWYLIEQGQLLLS